MRIFIDSADVTEIQRAWETGLVDGVTTNPSLISKSGRKPTDVYAELQQMGIKDVSMEVYASSNWQESIEKALSLQSYSTMQQSNYQ